MRARKLFQITDCTAVATNRRWRRGSRPEGELRTQKRQCLLELLSEAPFEEQTFDDDAQQQDRMPPDLVFLRGRARVESIELLVGEDHPDGYWDQRRADADKLSHTEFMKVWGRRIDEKDGEGEDPAFEVTHVEHPSRYLRKARAYAWPGPALSRNDQKELGRDHLNVPLTPPPLKRGDLTPPPSTRCGMRYFGVFGFTTREAAIRNEDTYVDWRDWSDPGCGASGPFHVELRYLKEGVDGQVREWVREEKEAGLAEAMAPVPLEDEIVAVQQWIKHRGYSTKLFFDPDFEPY